MFIWPNVSVNSKHYHHPPPPPKKKKIKKWSYPGPQAILLYQTPVGQASLEPLILINFTLLRHVQDLNHLPIEFTHLIRRENIDLSMKNM